MTRRDNRATLHARCAVAHRVASRIAVRLGTAVLGLALTSVVWTLAPAHPWITLRSGHQVRLLAMEHYDVPSESAVVLLFRYETHVPIEDTVSLRSEALSLWPTVQDSVERAGYSHVAFRTQGSGRGPLCWHNTGLCTFPYYGFLFERRPDARWYLSNGTRMTVVSR